MEDICDVIIILFIIFIIILLLGCVVIVMTLPLKETNELTYHQLRFGGLTPNEADACAIDGKKYGTKFKKCVYDYRMNR